jgi:hypothetical protein
LINPFFIGLAFYAGTYKKMLNAALFFFMTARRDEADRGHESHRLSTSRGG